MNLQTLQETSLKRLDQKVSVKVATVKKPEFFCCIVRDIQDLEKQKEVGTKIADEEYLRALKFHQDPRKLDINVSFEVLRSVDKLVNEKLRPMSVEPNHRSSFENWVKYKTFQEKLKKHYLGQQTLKEKIMKQAEFYEKDPENAPILFENWLRKKISEKKRAKKEMSKLHNVEVMNKLKQQQEGVSYKQWLKQSLAREKGEKRRRRENESNEEEKKREQAIQKTYEKQARRFLERKKRVERLSRLNFRKNIEQRQSSHSPLLLAYSPNKYPRYTDYSKLSTRHQDE